MTRRRLSFTLRTAFVTMILASIAIGFYVWWWPRYQAAETLDNAANAGLFAAWPEVKAAMVEDATFRKLALLKPPLNFVVYASEFNGECNARVVCNGIEWKIDLLRENTGWSITQFRFCPRKKFKITND